MAPSNSVQSVQMIFTGRVQGVGFRFTAQRFAHDLGVGGWVKNLPDNSVEMLVQGDKAGIDELVRQLKVHFVVHDVQLSASATMVTFKTFEIRY